MKIQAFESREEWLQARLGRISGSRLKDVIVKRGTGRKIGFYELIAERIGLPADGENPMDRGTRLEAEAIERFEAMTEKKVDPALYIWSRDENSAISVSPDGVVIGSDNTEAVEAKCISSARHIEAWITQEVPSEYKEQVLQYFIVNDQLQKLHLCFYDPRLKFKDFFILEVTRESVLPEIEATLVYEREILKEVDEIVNKLMEF